ncbi:uncharacterized protein KY384_001915 [Bacidia gigantensis]|uniref:uncharacterized protein n=1 Tax=Bacidia gigantensis TaxID=2732470 RepID=UPI001D04B4D0|nr:uncharacterized protein KY384_001915 [Bacidia gigantensis]KAG8533132.1 hypothetical protein KY384_001915 [Bacidia gigantensis]
MAMTATLATPALLAGAAYLDAKLQLHYDFREIAALVAVQAYMILQTRRNRINLFYLLESLSESRANDPFLVYQDHQWTYKEVYDTVLRYGTWLKQSHGVSKGEVVAIDFMNSPQFVFLWLAMWSIGAIPAFINYNLGGDALLHTIRLSGARLVIVDPEISSAFTDDIREQLISGKGSKTSETVETVVFVPDVEVQVMYTSPVHYPNDLRSIQNTSDMAILIFTSGTTGLPKAAIVNWIKIYRSGWLFSSLTNLSSKDRYYTCMPLYHATATLACVGPVLFTGSTLILGHRFSTSTFWPDLDPVTSENLDKKHNVKLAFGNGLRPDVWERFKSRFGIETIAEFYGATEGPIAFFNLSSNDWASGAIGRHGKFIDTLLGLGRITIVEVDWNTEAPARYSSKDGELCKKVARGEPGELLYALDATNPQSDFPGYYRNPSASEKKIVRDVYQKGDAFYRTGDVLRWDEEGRWWFVDRIGDTFRWKSENVSTSEVSEALGTHPDVLEANVYGVSIPHHDGRAGCAAVQLSPKITDTKAVMGSMATLVKQKLPKYAIPVFVRLVSEMDRTGTNKQTKAKLREEGADPAKVADGESLWWLKGGEYVPFGKRDWKVLEGGGVKM